MINTKLFDEIESEISREIGIVKEFLDSDCRNRDLYILYDDKLATLENMMDDLKDLVIQVEDYNGMEPSDYD